MFHINSLHFAVLLIDSMNSAFNVATRAIVIPHVDFL